MILEEGKKVLVVYRRLFEGDEARFFAGVVDGYEAGIVKVSGHSWMKDQFVGGLVEKPELRTKIFSIASGTLIVYLLPDLSDLTKLHFEHKKDGSLWLADGNGFQMNLTEKGHQRAVEKSR